MTLFTRTGLATLIMMGAMAPALASAQSSDVDVNITDDSNNISVQTSDQNGMADVKIQNEDLDIDVQTDGIDFGGEDGGIDFGFEEGDFDTGLEGSPEVSDVEIETSSGGLNLDLGILKIDKDGGVGINLPGVVDIDLTDGNSNIDILDSMVSVTDDGVGVNVPGVKIETNNSVSLGAEFETAALTQYLEAPNQAVNVNILFTFDSDKLTAAGEAQVAQIAASLDEFSNRTRFEIQGHTDAMGSDDYNQNLSERRAGTVSRILQNTHNIKQALIVTGKGEIDPVATNATDVGRAQNRRVTIVNLGKS